MNCVVANEIQEGDWIYIHHDGKIFNANTYPFELIDGRAKRKMLIGETINYNNGDETEDIGAKPLFPPIKRAYSV